MKNRKIIFGPAFIRVRRLFKAGVYVKKYGKSSVIKLHLLSVQSNIITYYITFTITFNTSEFDFVKIQMQNSVSFKKNVYFKQS